MHIMDLRAAGAHAHVAAGETGRVLRRRHADDALRVAGRVDAINLLRLDLRAVDQQLLLQNLGPVRAFLRPLKRNKRALRIAAWCVAPRCGCGSGSFDADDNRKELALRIILEVILVGVCVDRVLRPLVEGLVQPSTPLRKPRLILQLGLQAEPASHTRTHMTCRQLPVPVLALQREKKVCARPHRSSPSDFARRSPR